MYRHSSRYFLIVGVILLVVLMKKQFTNIGPISTHEEVQIPYMRENDDAGAVSNVLAGIYPNSSKGFVLASIDAMELNITEKDTMTEALHSSGKDAKLLLAALANTSNDLELKKLSDEYQKRLPGEMIIGCKKCGT